MKLSAYLKSEWKPALGCTEPASIAYAASLAAAQADGEVRAVHLRCDPRIYKNCYAVGIPNSGHQTGILWALAIGCHLKDPSLKLECFSLADADVLARAAELLRLDAITVQVDRSFHELLVDCRVIRAGGTGRAILERSHTAVTRLEKNGETVVPEPACAGPGGVDGLCEDVAAELESMRFAEFLQLARSASPDDRKRLREGAEYNLSIAKHGLAILGSRFSGFDGLGSLTPYGQSVFAGVNARMHGESKVVMSLAGSGNKGITCSVPLALFAEDAKHSSSQFEEALALACLMTSRTTRHLGTLSAICGCTNAAGIGLAAGLVYLQGGGEKELALAVNNMVGNITGMICDGAKIGCALKAMTAVDAAFRAASLAMAGIGIPETDGIVAATGEESLRNVGRIAHEGMDNTDSEILGIMQAKLRTRGGDRAK